MKERKELIEQLRLDYTASSMAIALMKQAADALQSQAERIKELEADAARFNWALPILSGDDDNIANHRALALGLKLMQGMSTTDAIDAARKETP